MSSLGAQIVHVTSDGSASAKGDGTTYQNKTNSTSWVGCADKTSDEQYSPDLIGRIGSAISL